MRAFLGTVLSVIAAGVLLIAYGLLAPRADAVAAYAPQQTPVVYDAQSGTYQLARPVFASERVALPNGLETAAYPAPAYTRAAGSRAVNDGVAEPEPVRTVAPAPAPRRTTAHTTRDRGRTWKQTAMIIGGTTAAGAGLGAIFGGKKGALIGAAIGGGAGTIYEVKAKK